jgi:GR25 family glycosyltransferase involved in LPS biosynthesis
MKSFIIHLSKIKSSLQSALETRHSLANVGINAELFEGTYGNDAVTMFDKENRQVHHIDGVNLTTGKVLNPGVKGCFYSHYRLWKKCAELNEPIMIFEDDLVVLNSYNPIEFEEILILSINYDWGISEPWKKFLEEKNSLSTAQPYTSRFIPGAAGYILKPALARKLINLYKNSYLPADVAINNKICKLEIHPQLLGRSKTMAEKESMTRSKHW